MIARTRLDRRSLLKGMGTAVALPFLDAMVPALAGSGRSGGKAPMRLAFAYVPNGIIMKDWTPAAEGALAADLPRTLQPLAAFRRDMTVLSGLTLNGGRALGDGPGDHARAAASYLTGVHPKKTAGADIHAGISVDQVAAQAIGARTRFASVELGCEDGRLVGNCDSGYSCAYSNSLSWRSATTPNPPEINPRAVFERLFQGFDPSESAAARARRERYQKSILDFVSDDTRKLTGKLGPTDRRKIDEYLTAVREIEQRIELAEKQAREGNRPVTPDFEIPEGVPAEFHDHVRLMFDLLAVAFQADLTRVATFMITREGSNRTYREIGVPDPHHGISHHRNDPELVDKLHKINRYHVEQLAYFVEKLRSIPEGDGTLLDHTLLSYGSGLADGNRHTHHDLPLVLLGGKAAGHRAGRHVRYAQETPMTNYYLTVLDRAGARTESLGDSSGQLEHLTDM